MLYILMIPLPSHLKKFLLQYLKVIKLTLVGLCILSLVLLSYLKETPQ